MAQSYWFGWISPGAEELRLYNLSLGAMYPYLNGSDVRICPSMENALSQFKLKATNMVFSYGYNFYLSTPPGKPVINATGLRQPAQTALFADAAQVNNFQAPASPSNPMLEELYYVDLETNYPSPLNYPNGHFRHDRKGQCRLLRRPFRHGSFVPGSIDQLVAKPVCRPVAPGDSYPAMTLTSGMTKHEGKNRLLLERRKRFRARLAPGAGGGPV